MAPPAQNDTSPKEHQDQAPGTENAPVYALIAVLVCTVALGATLILGGAVFAQIIPGMERFDSGEFVRWGMPIAKTVMDTAAVLTIGLMLMAVVLLGSDRGQLSPQAVGYVRAGTWTALAWVLGAVGTLYFQTAEFLGRRAGQITVDEVTAFAGSIGSGVALMFVILITTGIALFGRTITTATGGLWLLVASLVAVTPPALTGHAASSGAHELAVTGLALHLISICAWVGGLAVVTYHAMRKDGQEPAVAAHRFSRMALWAYVGVAISGAASAMARLYSLDDLFVTDYGRIILVKIALFVVLGFLGYAHRTRVLTRIDAAPGGKVGYSFRRRSFLRLAGAEVLIMAAVMGVSVGLGRTAPPTPPTEGTLDPAAAILGFAIPPAMSLENVLTLWRPDLFFIMFVVVAGFLYLGGVRRLVKRGDKWPVGRTVAFLLGLLTIVAVQLSGFATYAMIMFSMHMIQHMVLAMVTPILLVLGAPVTLALRALRPAETRGDRGPREWLNAFLNSRFSQIVTHPAVAGPIFVFSPYALYFTPLFPTLMNDHLGHLFMGLHFLVSGFLFYWVIVGVDPAPRKVPFLLRILLLLVAMGFHAFFGIAIMEQATPMAMQYYGQFDIPWMTDQAADQYAGGGIAWALGEIPTVMVMLALVVQWSRDDERQERRRERHSRRGGSDDADMDDYNAYLAELDRRSRAAAGGASGGGAPVGGVSGGGAPVGEAQVGGGGKEASAGEAPAGGAPESTAKD
ncbi:cytochrome c oxidase assembly protein [Nocardiopsis sp. B62]|uniref:cytochrome c oxidase assembly protein n=1 Tax=Nocardiopsis sp. B62 TaxID=2824874 RepID=UPI001B3925B6|nr:cytochrome c oxidase assembly protein [Nocardiopsis sp. B62]MBQ1082908.1 bifunctional copper resistance protein CopD/cytochrome c oxidase assembly protein [Nocardiopsis sp. B62]